MSRLEIDLLGEARFRFDGRPWRLTASPKVLPLLVLLSLESEPQKRAALASALWPEETDRDARANLRRHLHALARALPEIDGVAWIESTPTTVQWNPSAPSRCDLREFIACAGEPSTWTAATALYRGELLAGTFDECVVGLRERFATQHIGLLAELAVAARTKRNYADAMNYAEAILEIDEWREDMVRLLMGARNTLGDRSGALAAFERFAHRLHDELRTEPMFETVALRDAILAGTLPVESDPPPPPATSTRSFVGRTSEIETLTGYWLRAARGSGSTAFIFGEAGIGKTRLSLELQNAVESQGGRAIVGRTSKPESIPYQPIIEALRQAVPFVRREPRDDRWLAALLPFVPEIRRIGGDVDELAQLDGSRARVRLHDAFARAFEACARIRPLTVILEDVHWAQPDTIDAIGTLAESIPSSPIFLIVTYRSTDAPADSPVRALRRRLARASLANHVSLGRLGLHAVREMVTTSTASSGAAFAEEVYAQSEGNPLFAWQLIHDRTERGAEEHAAALTVGDAILRRLDHLELDARVVAEVAATIGDTFTVEEIAEVGGWDESRVFAGLARLLDRQLVAERAGASFEYGFTHALIGSAIYGATTLDARRTRHRRSADVLERTRLDRGGVLPLIAQHWLRADDTDRARAAFLAAARAALASYARHDARALAQRALDLNPSPQERFDALRLIIEATEKFVDIDAAVAALTEFESISQSLGRGAEYDALLTRITFHENHAERNAQTEVTQRLAAFVRPSDPREWKVEALLRRVTVAMQRGMSAAGEAELAPVDPNSITQPQQRYQYHYLLAVSLFRQGKFPEGKAQLAHFRAYVDKEPGLEAEWLYAFAAHRNAWFGEDATAIVRSATNLIELAGRRGDIANEAAGRMDLAVAKHHLLDTTAARAEFHQALDLWSRARQWQGWANTIINLGVAERQIGHIDRAVDYWTQGLDRERQAGGRFATVIVQMNLAEVDAFRGHHESALARLKPLPAEVEGTGEERLIAELDLVLGRAYFDCGEIDRGLDLMRSGAKRLHRSFTVFSNSFGLVGYLNALVESDRRDDIPAIAGVLDAALHEDPHAQGAAQVCLALAAVARLDGDRAREITCMERGRDAARARLDGLTDESDRVAFSRMYPYDFLLAYNHSHATA